MSNSKKQPAQPTRTVNIRESYKPTEKRSYTPLTRQPTGKRPVNVKPPQESAGVSPAQKSTPSGDKKK